MVLVSESLIPQSKAHLFNLSRSVCIFVCRLEVNLRVRQMAQSSAYCVEWRDFSNCFFSI